MKYVKVKWPEIQDYMNHKNYLKESYYDPDKDVWFIPESWEKESDELCLFDRNGIVNEHNDTIE